MKKAILATKVGMTQIFNEDGSLIPVTVLQAGPCVVTQIKTVENDGYSAVQVGFVDKKDKIVNKDKAGKNRIHALTEELIHIERELDNPTNNDAFYGRVDCLLAELEELMDNFKNTK